MNLPLNWTIRDAVPDDAAAIAAIMRDCWPDDTPELQRITRLIQSGRHVTRCASDGTSCVGFVDAFSTTDAAGRDRWEIDLLAVHSAARGQGIGKALIAAALEAAPSDAKLARGLIRIGNEGSERAFTALGFQSVDASLALCVARALASESVQQGGFVVPVETFTYSGLWLESPPSPDVLSAARIHAAALGVGQVGTLVFERDEGLCVEAGYEMVGNFRWWVRRL